MADLTRYHVVFAEYEGRPNVLAECDGDCVRQLVAKGKLRPNDRIKPVDTNFFFFAHQLNLFSAEQLAGVTLREDNLPPEKRGTVTPEQAPYALLERMRR